MEGGGDTFDRRGSGCTGEEEDLAIEGALGEGADRDAGNAVAEHEVGKEGAGAGGADHLDEDQEVIGGVAQVGFEAAECSAGADLHLTMTGARLAGGPPGVGELRHLDRVFGCQRMCQRQDQPHVLPHERLPSQVAMHRPRLAGVLVADHRVELPQAKRRHRLLDLSLSHLDPDVGVTSTERGDSRSHDAQEGGLKSRHPYDARRVARGDRGHLGLGCLHPIEQGGRVPDQRSARVGKPHVPAGPFEQLCACLTLEHRELLGDGARCVAKRPRGAVNGSAGVEFAEQSEAAEIEHRSEMLLGSMHKEEMDVNS